MYAQVPCPIARGLIAMIPAGRSIPTESAVEAALEADHYAGVAEVYSPTYGDCFVGFYPNTNIWALQLGSTTFYVQVAEFDWRQYRKVI